jgi:hypothetical protein
MEIPDMLRKLLILTALATGFAYSLGAAAIPPIKSQTQEGEEAESIAVEFERNRSAGRAVVEGCIRCPLTLQIDEQTRFFAQGKPISRRQAESLSGNGGTVIFENGHVVRIRW